MMQGPNDDINEFYPFGLFFISRELGFEIIFNF